MENIIFFVIFGLIAGAIANYIDPHPSSGGIAGYIVLGIIGAIVGGYIGRALFGVTVTGFNISSFVIAVMGSLLTLWVGRMLMSRRT